MRSIVLSISILLFIIFYSSCRKDFEYETSNGQLRFSRDTVYLDTIFSSISSSTYSLKVYNNSNTDVQIPQIRLTEGENSGYRLNVDGVAGKTFNSVPLLAKDSLYIFIETTLDVSDMGVDEFLYTDAIIFDQGSIEQKVELVTLVRDAVFLYPEKNPDGSRETITVGYDNNGEEIIVEGFILEDGDLNFTNEKPYVIYGFAGVDANKTLLMDPGVRVHFHKNSGIVVGDSGRLVINGSLSRDSVLLENEVIFEGDRLEPRFSTIPGQWEGIYLARGSMYNTINHLTIKNATTGLYIEGNGEALLPQATITNSRIYNSSNNALKAISTNITAENLVLGSAGFGSLVCRGGGNYRFLHSTIANYWSNGFRTGAALQLNNQYQGRVNDLTAEFTNCIVDGNSFMELNLIGNEQGLFSFKFTNALIKYRDLEGTGSMNPYYDFENTDYYENILLNQSADFKNTFTEDFRIGANSAAIGNAQLEAALEVPNDIIGRDRTIDPDIGAFETILDL